MRKEEDVQAQQQTLNGVVIESIIRINGTREGKQNKKHKNTYYFNGNLTRPLEIQKFKSPKRQIFFKANQPVVVANRRSPYFSFFG